MTEKTVATFGDALDICVRKYMLETGEKSYSTALGVILEQNPEAARAYDEEIRTMAVTDSPRTATPSPTTPPVSIAMRGVRTTLDEIEEELARLKKPLDLRTALLRKRSEHE